MPQRAVELQHLAAVECSRRLARARPHLAGFQAQQVCQDRGAVFVRDLVQSLVLEVFGYYGGDLFVLEFLLFI